MDHPYHRYDPTPTLVVLVGRLPLAMVDQRMLNETMDLPRRCLRLKADLGLSHAAHWRTRERRERTGRDEMYPFSAKLTFRRGNAGPLVIAFQKLGRGYERRREPQQRQQQP